MTIPIFTNLVSLKEQTTASVTQITKKKKKGILSDLLRYPGIGVCVEGLNEVAKLCGALQEKDMDVSTAIPSHMSSWVPAIES